VRVAHDTEITDNLENAGFVVFKSFPNFLRLDPCLAAPWIVLKLIGGAISQRRHTGLLRSLAHLSSAAEK